MVRWGSGVSRLLPALLLAVVGLMGQTISARAWSPSDLVAPCGDSGCAFTIYTGRYVQNSLGQVLVTKPQPPTSWDYIDGDNLVATTFSRTTGPMLWNHVSMEPELGIGQRYGRQDETEFWGALFFRYHGFPWDGFLVTTVAASVGLNWATGISEVEQERARDGKGSQLMHFFAPEITLAYPSAPNYQLVLRMHHRSGVFGLVSDAWGGAQYGSIGLRIWF